MIVMLVIIKVDRLVMWKDELKTIFRGFSTLLAHLGFGGRSESVKSERLAQAAPEGCVDCVEHVHGFIDSRSVNQRHEHFLGVLSCRRSRIWEAVKEKINFL